MVGVLESNGNRQPATPSARVPLSVFSQSSSLMSDRAAQAMEKALRNLAMPHREDLLEHPEIDRRSFVKRDAADLFNSLASANDKDRKLTTGEMSLPRAFYSRVDVQDSAYSATELSGSEDSDITHRRNLSTTVPGPLLLDRSVFSDSETDKDSSLFLGTAPEDLDLVENAMLRIIREDTRAFSKQRDEDATKPKELSECLEKSEGFRSTADSVDFQLLSRLLEQVQALREQKHQPKQVGRIARSSSRGARSMWDISKSGKSKRFKNDDMKKAIEAATQAAKSAAEAAITTATLVTQNSDAVNKLLQIMHLSSKTSDSEPEVEDTRVDSESEDIEESSDSDETKDIAKKIVSQNRYTHVVLGIMLVSSFVWRYIVVKVVKNVKSKVTDPWGYIGGMLPDGFRGPDKEAEKSEESSSGPSMPQKAIHFLHGDREKEKEASASDDKDKQTLTLGNILPIKPKNIQ
nr:uncharacterized protein LOC112276973 isoform X2 [Physcomitrium patens]|eukprot:XP_024364604.1 uncharacterized protein LOC112276973 isoform X2 [Physcomitrella patens]